MSSPTLVSTIDTNVKWECGGKRAVYHHPSYRCYHYWINCFLYLRDDNTTRTNCAKCVASSHVFSTADRFKDFKILLSSIMVMYLMMIWWLNINWRIDFGSTNYDYIYHHLIDNEISFTEIETNHPFWGSCNVLFDFKIFYLYLNTHLTQVKPLCWL